ncbi:unnamed protein product [Colias eurytheme]|nr:unnamed protein product [Colias eurytheme]
MQRMLDQLPEWLDKWRLRVNPKKTQAICMGCAPNPENLAILKTKIPWSNKITYLGVEIDRRLHFNHQAQKAARQAQVAAVRLRPLFASSLPTRLKLRLFNTYVKPKILYAAPVWYGYISETSKKKLRTAQSRTLRVIVDAPRYAKKMYEKSDTSDFAHLRTIAPWHSSVIDTKPYPRDLARDKGDASPPHLVADPHSLGLP